ncbi:Zinc transporter ZupT [compost metagenome]|jgi:zinc and cadmium transporter|uniref:Predicted divalent heavy-metal cations transporter n=3 Tax=Cupriavidus necator TaxID=106590 RepID=Q0K854_CUPNH|nr:MULTISPECIES: ZIP family metal transporter [Cupriavidus]AEI77950.1 divalent heavy-metal cations transporter [Cupriavidus necator N-1]EYS86960.1 ZIP zinc transporter [Cupriavidus sp. SK-4]KAI3606689.1 Zinc transporter, ZIP family [Cupriavidus necator H850]KUE90471.1 ZIP zinc transporter [Cupriavidus necator]MDX6013520.1 ZIP family metal transporter [Cupriavidus necator]
MRAERRGRPVPPPREPIIHSTLLYILLAATISGVGSIFGAALLSLTVASRVVERMVSFSVGVLLATALLHSLPEAFESGADPRALFGTLLAGLLGFFLLEKISLLRHSHHHEGDGHHHHHGHDREEAGRSGLTILVGDTFHNFADGIVIAAAFLADPHIGVVTALAIAAHEIPQEVGDFIVLLNAGFSKARAFAFNLLSSLAAIAGGVVGYFLLDQLSGWIPYVLVIAASSFLYIAVSDLMPQMQRKPRWRESAIQVVLVAAGISAIVFITNGVHESHSHGGHGHIAPAAPIASSR